MDERDYFNEKQETKRASFVCPHCRERGDYDVRWLKRTKKQTPPRGANEMDRARFAKLPGPDARRIAPCAIIPIESGYSASSLSVGVSASRRV